MSAKAAMTDLLALPRDHVLRNKPLAEIGAQTRFRGIDEETGRPFRWKAIEPRWAIARNTLNEIAPRVWLDPSEWRAPADQRGRVAQRTTSSLAIEEAHARLRGETTT